MTKQPYGPPMTLGNMRRKIYKWNAQMRIMILGEEV
jgi:hypothetical protein